jgi:SAM-dependent methyltransferase
VSLNWISHQIDFTVAQWDSSMENAYPQVKEWNKDSAKYYHQVCEKCNFLDAVRLIDWDHYINTDAIVVDLGCGGGWLSGYLSRFENIKSIFSVDTSKNYLHTIMPGVIDIMGGDAQKITTVEGMFSPIQMENHSIDLIVASAALHHADNLPFLLLELHDKLKKGGTLMIINETPSEYFKYLARLLRAFSKIFIRALFKRYTPLSQKLSSSCFEYDPYLGDKMYPLWYWKEAIRRSGFELVEVIDSKMATVKGTKKESLKHFICKAI